MIEFRGINKIFKRTIVLHNINFEIEKGTITVLVGPSGCGKTTTLKMINRLIKPTSGKIFINGEDISKKNLINFRRNIGYVIQQVGLFPHMTIRENIEIVAKLQKMKTDEIDKRAKELMEMVGLDYVKFAKRYPAELSGGQQQRVGIARALMTEPEIILMDEPFSALDPVTRTQLQDELINIQTQFKKTIIFVTHDMDEAIKIADKICIMGGGNIVQYDTPENILKNPINEFVSDFVGKNRIWSSPEYIKVEDIMVDNPVTCFENFSLFRCMKKMSIARVDRLLVVDNRNKLIGVITGRMVQRQEDRDILVKEVMVKPKITTLPNTSLLEILKKVTENNLSTVPVVDDDGILKGLVTKSSLVTTLSRQYEFDDGGDDE